MAQRRRGTAWRQLNDMLVALIVAVEIAERALDAVALARPRPDFDRLHVLDVHATDQRRAFALTPFLVQIETSECRLFFRIQAGAGCAHGDASALTRFYPL